MPQMTPEHVVEDLHAALFVRIAQRQHLGHQVRMRADGALAEDDQVARQDVGAFDRDGDGHGAVQRTQVVARPVDHAPARVHVHGVVDRLAHALGRVIFHDAGYHGRLDALVQGRAGQAARGLDQVGVAGQVGQLFLHALEAPHRQAELLAHARVHAGGVSSPARPPPPTARAAKCHARPPARSSASASRGRRVPRRRSARPAARTRRGRDWDRSERPAWRADGAGRSPRPAHRPAPAPPRCRCRAARPGCRRDRTAKASPSTVATGPSVM